MDPPPKPEVPSVPRKCSLSVGGVAMLYFEKDRLKIIGGNAQWDGQQLIVDTPPGIYTDGVHMFTAGDQCCGRNYTAIKKLETIYVDIPPEVVFYRITTEVCAQVTFEDDAHLADNLCVSAYGTSHVNFGRFQSVFSKISGNINGCSSMNGSDTAVQVLDCQINGTSHVNDFYITSAVYGSVSGVSRIDCTCSRSASNYMGTDFCSKANIYAV